MGEPIRTWYFGREAVTGTLAATRQNMYFEGEPNHTPHPGNQIPALHNGTVMQDMFVVQGNRWSEYTVRAPVMYSQSGYWLACAVGPPSDTLMVTGANFHRFLAGPATSPPSGSHQVYDGVEWEQLLGSKCISARFNLSATALPMVDLHFGGTFGANISAPTPIAVPAVTFTEPVGQTQQLFNLNGADASFMSGSLTFTNGFTPYYTARLSADINRMKRAFYTADLDMTLDYAARAGSLYDSALSGGKPGALQFRWIDVNTTLAAQGAVATTLGTAVTAGNYVTVTPVAMTAILIGSRLTIDTAGSQEEVVVQAVTGTTFTAYFNKTHAGSATVVHASVNINPLFQIDVFKPLLADPTKTADQQERAQHIVGKAGYGVQQGTVTMVSLIDANTAYAGS